MHGITAHTEHLTRRYVSREWHLYRKIWRIFSICLIHRNSPSLPAFDGLNYDDVTWESWQYRSKTAWLFVQRRIPVVKKKEIKSIKASFRCSFVRGICRLQTYSPHKGTVVWKAFSCQDGIIRHGWIHAAAGSMLDGHALATSYQSGQPYGRRSVTKTWINYVI